MNYQKLASESGLTYQVPSKQIFYGKIGGFMVTLSRRLSAVNVAIAFAGSEEAVSTFFGRLNMYKGNTKNGVAQILYKEGYAVVSFVDTFGTKKRVQSFLIQLAEMLQIPGLLGTDNCGICKNAFDLSTSKYAKLVNSEAVVLVHDACVRGVETAEDEAILKQKEEGENIGRGTLGAFLGAIVGAIPWTIIALLGYVASILGFVMSLCVKKGYELLGGKVCRKKFFIVLVFSILSLLIAQAATQFISLLMVMKEYGLPMSTFGPLANALLTDSEYITEVLLSTLLGFVFAVLGCVALLRDTWKEASSLKTKFLDVEYRE